MKRSHRERVSGSALFEQLPSDVLLRVLTLAFPARESDAAQFLQLAALCLVNGHMHRFMTRHLFSCMRTLPPAHEARLTLEQLALFAPGLEQLDLTQNKGSAGTGDWSQLHMPRLRLLELAHRAPLLTMPVPPRLHQLVLCNSRARDADLMRFTTLRSLHLLKERYLTGETLPQLQHLALLHNRALWPRFLHRLTALTALEVTGPDAAFLRGNDLVPLGGQLRSLRIRWSCMPFYREDGRFRDHGALPRMTALTKLVLADCAAVPRDTLAGLTRLRTLKLRNAPLMDYERDLGSLTSLTHLKLCGVTLSEAGACVARLVCLTRLSLRSCSCITDAALTGLTALTRLDLTGNNTITAQGLQPLVALRHLTLYRTWRFTNECLSHLVHLKWLDVRLTRAIEPATLIVPPHCTVLI